MQSKRRILNRLITRIGLRKKETNLDLVTRIRHGGMMSENAYQLLMAAKAGDDHRVKVLLDIGGPDIVAAKNNALDLAAYHGHTRAVIILLEAGADPHNCNDEALRDSMKNGHTETARVLKEWMDKTRQRPSKHGPKLRP